MTSFSTDEAVINMGTFVILIANSLSINHPSTIILLVQGDRRHRESFHGHTVLLESRVQGEENLHFMQVIASSYRLEQLTNGSIIVVEHEPLLFSNHLGINRREPRCHKSPFRFTIQALPPTCSQSRREWKEYR